MFFDGEYAYSMWLNVVAKCPATSGNEPQSLSSWLVASYGVNYGDSVENNASY